MEGAEHQHCSRVLRKKAGDQITVTDGNGGMAVVEILDVGNNQTAYRIISTKEVPSKQFHVHLAMAPTKQLERTEWFVEKATELGVDEISFFNSKNSERKTLKLDRLERKTISALKQSKGAWKTRINPMKSLKDILKIQAEHKVVAHVSENHEYMLDAITNGKSVLLLVGPEGDFDEQEVNEAKDHGFLAVSLGKRVLRTETAGIVGVQIVNAVNRY